ncbi:MAG: polysaccharide deacetylase family protein [Clostridia bacterium]|nr:polysaccharide deacetylase family protein [Clostridia bacterium]
MPVFVVTKKMCIIVLILLAAASIALIAIFAGGKKESEPQNSITTLTEVGEYELNALPALSKELPIYGVGREDKKIALTIDAAWDTDKTAFILETLDKYEIKATFFLCGVWVEAYPDYVKQIAEKGHEIGNHSKTHPHMNSLTASQIQEEISLLDDEIEAITGTRCKLFRAPFGEYNNTVVLAVRDIGYEVIQWTRDTVDWKESRSTQQILDSVLPNLTSGDIILCHNNGYKIEEYLPTLIETAMEQGFEFVTVTELLLSGETTIDNQGIQQAK